MQREKLEPRGSPAQCSPPGASQQPPLSLPLDLTVVYSHTATRIATRTSDPRRLSPHAAPDWLGHDPTHCPTPPPLRQSSPPSPAQFQISPGRPSRPVHKAWYLIGSSTRGTDQETGSSERKRALSLDSACQGRARSPESQDGWRPSALTLLASQALRGPSASELSLPSPYPFLQMPPAPDALEHSSSQAHPDFPTFASAVPSARTTVPLVSPVTILL